MHEMRARVHTPEKQKRMHTRVITVITRFGARASGFQLRARMLGHRFTIINNPVQREETFDVVVLFLFFMLACLLRVYAGVDVLLKNV